MKVPNAAHEAHPWVIAQIAPDFKLLDVRALAAYGALDEFDSFLRRRRCHTPTGFVVS
jgi:hypothetical protein